MWRKGPAASCSGAGAVPEQQRLQGTISSCSARAAAECCNGGNPMGRRRSRGEGVLQNRCSARAAAKHRLW